MTQRAVFLDVDGTLVNDRGLVPESARDAVARARAKGAQVSLNTGRSTSELWEDIVSVGFDGVIAAAGGYVARRSSTRCRLVRPSRRRVLPAVEPRPVRQQARAAADARARLRTVRDEDVLAEMEKGLGGFIDSLRPLPDPLPGDINKISFLDSHMTVEQVRHDLDGVFDVIPATVPTFGPNSGEVSKPGITKGTAVELLIGHLGIGREDTVAFGDGLNDLEMLAFVGVGVAMGNAHPEVLAVTRAGAASLSLPGSKQPFPASQRAEV